MSLKAFHVVFLIVSGLLCLGLGLWLYSEDQRTKEAEFLWGMGLSLVFLVALAAYGRWFTRKLRGVSYL